MVRSILETDTPAVAELCRTALGHTVLETQLQKNITMLKDHPGYYIRVFEDDTTPGKVTGFIQAQCYDILYGENGWNIIALAADPSSQRHGIGKALLHSLEQYARSHGAAFVRLNSRIERTDAHGFYEHMGYICDKTQKRYIRYFTTAE